MVNITHKETTHRRALAEAIVHTGSMDTMSALLNGTVPKGNVYEIARAAGLLAAKRTSDMIPDCHPLPIEFASISYQTHELSIAVKVEIQTVYKTGVEVEAMHAASVVALTIYDMLKPIDKNVYIGSIRLMEKQGGKSDLAKKKLPDLNAVVIVCSDTISKGTKEDRAGKAIIEKLSAWNIKLTDYIVIPDEKEVIREKVKAYCKDKVNLLILTGGTGLSPRDVTPEALEPLIEKRIPGIEEAIRAYGQRRTPFSMLSRSLAGITDETLILALPGSTRGASESMDAVFPHVLHIFRVMKGSRHD